MSISYFEENRVNKLAYVHVPSTAAGEALPAVMFLGGFRSDMEGTKAQFLEAQCRERGQEFVRFDYTGHGKSGGKFVDGCIGVWCDDARDILDHVLKSERVVLVGSSMGGWISLLLILERAERVCGLVGIAAAPDFTEEVEAKLSDAQKERLRVDGYFEEPNEYSDEPYIFTQALIDDGRAHCLLDRAHDVSVPMILLQGKKDNAVPWQKALCIQERFGGEEVVRVIFVDEGDHSLSREGDLALLDESVVKLSLA